MFSVKSGRLAQSMSRDASLFRWLQQLFALGLHKLRPSDEPEVNGLLR
jgi:hypothetical protein